MNRADRKSRLKLKAQGFSMVMTVFVVVVLALVSGFIVSISTLSIASGNLSLLATQSFFAAQSGLEWARFAIQSSGSPYHCPSSPTTLSLNQGGLSGFSARISCTEESFTENDTTYKIFNVTSVGSYTSASGLENTMRQMHRRIVQPGI